MRAGEHGTRERSSRWTHEILSQCPYLRCFMYECLRMYPPSISAAPRECAAVSAEGNVSGEGEGVELGGFRLPAKSKLMLNFHGAHHHHAFWAEPQHFEPLRFNVASGRTNVHNAKSNDHVDLEAVTVAPYSPAFFPFGYGGHGCIGRNLAQQAALLVFGSLVALLDLGKHRGDDTAIDWANFNATDSEQILGFMDAVNKEGVTVALAARPMSASEPATKTGSDVADTAPFSVATKISSGAGAGSGSGSSSSSTANTRVYTREEVAEHCTASDCWLVIGEDVLDVSAFLDSHPGGREVLVSQAGKDATKVFELIQHSDFGRKEAKKFVVGRLAEGAAGTMNDQSLRPNPTAAASNSLPLVSTRVIPVPGLNEVDTASASAGAGAVHVLTLSASPTNGHYENRFDPPLVSALNQALDGYP